MRVSRRRLLQGGAIGAASLAAPHPIRRALFEARPAFAAPPDAIFVLFQFEGGNDGLGTVIPTDDVGHPQRTLYDAVRPGIGVPVGALGATGIGDDPVRGTGLALHPAMTGLKTLYDQGKVAVINGVAYPGQSLSHFRSEDIWFGGLASTAAFDEGWFGRYLDEQFAPTDLVTVDVDNNLSKNFFNPEVNVLALRNISEFVVPDDPAFPDLTAKKAALAQAYAAEVSAGAPGSTQLIISTTGDVLLDKIDIYDPIPTGWASALDAVSGRTARRFKQAASIIRYDHLHPGSATGARFFHVRLGGFDTHSGQTANGGLTGRQPELLDEASRCIKAFYDDMVAIGVSSKVLMMTQSEFGRRVAQNGNLGTDHGEASVLFAIGDPVVGGVYGELPKLDDLSQGNLKWKIDFRQVYATVIDDWLGADHTTILSGGPFTTLPIIA
jgi:uncharacterized protein (DUF1501 family)